jgi:hypothetical protein
MSPSLSKPFNAFILASKPERDTVIDLTGDDGNAELKRALEASLSTSAYPPSSSQLRPSDRAPDPNWAMVPSNVCSILPCLRIQKVTYLITR